MGDWVAAGRWEGGLWGCGGGGGWGRCLRPSPLRTLGAVGQATLQRTIRDSKFYRVSSLAGREKEKVTCSMQQLCLPPGLRVRCLPYRAPLSRRILHLRRGATRGRGLDSSGRLPCVAGVQHDYAVGGGGGDGGSQELRLTALVALCASPSHPRPFSRHKRRVDGGVGTPLPPLAGGHALAAGRAGISQRGSEVGTIASHSSPPQDETPLHPQEVAL